MLASRRTTAALVTISLLVAMAIYMITTLADGVLAAFLNKSYIMVNNLQPEQPYMLRQPNSIPRSNSTMIQIPKNYPGPDEHLVFLKTHKTASSTVTSVLQRYGFLRHLSFLMPKCGHILDTYKPFDASKVLGISPTSAKRKKLTFNFLTSHARYNRRDMNMIFPGAKYVTILRNPASQFESMFYYFEMFKYLPKKKNSLRAFFDDPKKNFRIMVSKSEQLAVKRMHNQQLFDLGFDQNDMSNDSQIEKYIHHLHDEFDLVMITEYFDESMLLLNKMMHWSLKDVRYIWRGARQPSYREPLSDRLRTQIRAWNSADVKLYEYFNRTFWIKVKEYGPDFDDDLRTFRQLQHNLVNTCRDLKSDAMTDRRVLKERPRKKAPDWCLNFFRDDKQFTGLLRKRMQKKGLPLYDSCDSKKSRTTKRITT